MRKRNRVQKRVRELFAQQPTTSASPDRHSDSKSLINRSPTDFPLAPDNGILTSLRDTSNTNRTQDASSSSTLQITPPTPLEEPRRVLAKAIRLHLEKIPQDHREAFERASKSINERTILADVRKYDATHRNTSSFRPYEDRLSKFFQLIHRFMGGVSIGIQSNPEISALAVGAIRIVVDLALKFTTFFSRLIDMMCMFEDYLAPLAEYALVANHETIEKTVVNAYINVLDFGWKARRVFVDLDGNARKWISFRAFFRQHWENFESEFTSIKEDMEHHLSVLLHSVQALHFDAHDQAELARRRDSDRTMKAGFLSWVSDIDFEKVHQDTCRKRHDNTCDWLIQDHEYRRWLKSPGSALLWCHGKPGIGKSVLASYVIEDITRLYSLKDHTAICFAYYNYRDPRLGDISQILAALVKQLCRRRQSIPQTLLRMKHDALPPTMVGNTDVMASLTEDLHQMFVVFDALDECPEEERSAILKFVTDLVTTQTPCQVKVFVTSRREMDIVKAFENKKVPTIQIRANDVAGDIETFARSQVKTLRMGKDGKFLYIDSDALAENVVTALATRANGMFLWVNLQLDNLCRVSKARREHLVEEALKSLPTNLAETYDRILERIEYQPLYMREIALDSLAWMFHPTCPLISGELQEALAIRRYSSGQTIEPVHTDVILEACGNLLEENNGTIRPIHYTVQEYFETTSYGKAVTEMKAQLSDQSFIHSRLALTCLKAMRLAKFENPAKTNMDLQTRALENTFADYSIRNFDSHMSHCPTLSSEILSEVEGLLNQDANFLAALLQIKRQQRIGEFNEMNFPVTAATFIFSTGLYNFSELRQRCIGQEPPLFALHLAASAGLPEAVIHLIASGCDPNERDPSGATPLYYACFEGNLKISHILIRAGADINASGALYGTALQAASNSGEGEIVKLLLDSGADVNIQGGVNGTAIEAATYQGYAEIIKLLFDHGADITVKDCKGDGLLHEATAQGHIEAIMIFLDAEADIEMTNDHGQTSLHLAARDGISRHC